MMKKRLAVIPLTAVLLLGSATAALAAGSGIAWGPNEECLAAECPAGQAVQVQAETANGGDTARLQGQLRTHAQVQDPTGDQPMVMTQSREQTRQKDPAGDLVQERNRDMVHAPGCDGNCDQDQIRARVQDRTCDGDCDQEQAQGRVQQRHLDCEGTPAANGNNGNKGGR